MTPRVALVSFEVSGSGGITSSSVILPFLVTLPILNIGETLNLERVLSKVNCGAA